MKKLLFLINPISGKTEGQKIQEKLPSILSRYLSQDQYDIVLTEPNMLDRLSSLSPDYDTLLAAGGDGTISNVIHAMACLKRKHKIGLIPMGTGNDLARSLGFLAIEDRSLENRIKIILRGNTKKVDILEINNRYVCINYLGLGNDARILNDFNGLRMNPANRYLFSGSMGKGVYAFAGLKSLNYKIAAGAKLSCKTHKNKEKQLDFNSEIRAILISNITSYGGGTNPSSLAQTDDGFFEVTVIKNIKEWVLLHLARFTKKPLNIICPEIDQIQTDRVEISLPKTTFCQIDGEIIDGLSGTEKKITVEVKSSVDMIVP